VVGSDGNLTGYSADKGISTKKELLMKEGWFRFIPMAIVTL